MGEMRTVMWMACVHLFTIFVNVIWQLEAFLSQTDRCGKFLLHAKGSDVYGYCVIAT